MIYFLVKSAISILGYSKNEGRLFARVDSNSNSDNLKIAKDAVKVLPPLSGASYFDPAIKSARKGSLLKLLQC